MADTDYAYAVSRVKALETRLIDRTTVDRLLSEDADGLLQWARESDYADGFAAVESQREFPLGLRQHLGGVFNMLERIVPVPEVIQAFRLRYDYHNLRVLFMANVLNRPIDGILAPLGTIPADTLANHIKDEAWLWIPEAMREAWRSAHAGLDRGDSLLVIGAGFDNARWQHRLALAESCGEPILDTLFREAITMHNIVTFIRAKDGAAAREDFDALLLDGGTLERAFFRRHYDEPTQLFLDSLGNTDYARHILTRATDALSGEHEFWRLDVARDNYFSYRTNQRAASPFGAAPVVHYLIEKKAEGKLLYTLWLAARAGWDRAVMRDRLRSAYA